MKLTSNRRRWKKAIKTGTRTGALQGRWAVRVLSFPQGVWDGWGDNKHFPKQPSHIPYNTVPAKGSPGNRRHWGYFAMQRYWGKYTFDYNQPENGWWVRKVLDFFYLETCDHGIGKFYWRIPLIHLKIRAFYFFMESYDEALRKAQVGQYPRSAAAWYKKILEDHQAEQKGVNSWRID